MHGKWRDSTVFAALSILSIDSSAWSAESSLEIELDPVVVTAQKRVENSQDISISVSKLSGNQLETLGITSLGEIANSVAGVRIR